MSNCCNCAMQPPTMPTYRSQHLPTCPTVVEQRLHNLERLVLELARERRYGCTCRAEGTCLKCRAVTLLKYTTGEEGQDEG